MARDAGVEPRKSRDDKKSSGTKHEDFYYEDGAPGSMSKTTEQKCPFPGTYKKMLTYSQWARKLKKVQAKKTHEIK